MCETGGELGQLKVYIVDAFIVCFYWEIGGGWTERPHFDCAVETGGQEGISILMIEGKIHDIVCMAFVCS